MKKILCISLVLLFIFSSCGKMYEKEILSDSNAIDTYDYDGLPMVVYATLTELKEIKAAFDSMQPDEFVEYMKNEKNEHYISGMRNYESAKDLLDELAATTVPLLDGNEKNFSEIGFYWERNEVQQLIFFNENSRVSSYNYTPKSGRDECDAFGSNNEKALLLKELNYNGVSALVYKTDKEETFFADVFVDDTYIFMRTKDIETIEEFEICFSRLQFVKIADLLNGTYTETTQVEGNLESDENFDKTALYSMEQTINEFEIVTEPIVTETTE